MSFVRNIILIVTTVALTLSSVSTVSAESTSGGEELGHTTILLLGIDTGDLGRVDHGRSDTMMVLDINKATKEGVLASIPRDAYVNIPGYGMDKINHAYAFGGAELSMATVNNFLGTDIDDYVVVNMAGLKEIIEAVGTIEVVPPSTFSIGGYSFTEGVSTELDSDMALAYARERYTSGGDYARQQRQRDIVQAVVNKAASIESVVNFVPMFSALSDNIATNLTLPELMSLFSTYNGASSIETFQLVGYGQMIDGIYYDNIDSGSLDELLEFIQS